MTVTSRKNYQTIDIRSAGLYNGVYGSSRYQQIDNAAEFSAGGTLYIGNFYAGQRVTSPAVPGSTSRRAGSWSKV